MSRAKPKVRTPLLSEVRTDGGTQPRSTIDAHLVDEYSAAMVEGAIFPPIVLFFDGVAYWLADGFHRYFAALGAFGEDSEANSEIHLGTVRDAILYSVGANAAHGLRRTNEDKRRAVRTLLNDETWAKWSDREIAKRCAVDGKTVAALRPAPSAEVPQTERTASRGGTTFTMKTGNIGRRPAEDDQPVFDSTSSGRAMDASPTPVSLAQDTEVQAFRARQAEAGDIPERVFDIVRAFDGLPDAVDAARRFPPGQRHAFDGAKAFEIATWFRAFGDAWLGRNGGRDAQAA